MTMSKAMTRNSIMGRIRTNLYLPSRLGKNKKVAVCTDISNAATEYGSSELDDISKVGSWSIACNECTWKEYISGICK